MTYYAYKVNIIHHNIDIITTTSPNCKNVKCKEPIRKVDI